MKFLENSKVVFSDENIKEIIKNFDIKNQESFVTSFVKDEENKYIVKITSDMSDYLQIVYDKILPDFFENVYSQDNVFYLKVDKYVNGKYIVSDNWRKAVSTMSRRLDLGYSVSYSWSGNEIRIHFPKN